MIHAGDKSHVRLKARGAGSNASGRFEPISYHRAEEAEDWTGAPLEGEADFSRAPPPPLQTQVFTDTARKVIAYNASPDLPYDRSINPYRGCEHGCIYCFARPSHAYLGLSPGLDFESRIFAKPDAAKRLEEELAKPGYKPAPLVLGANTDPYQPLEREMKVTRSILEVLAKARHPVSIVTKSKLVTRDLDILAPMAALGLASLAVSLTTLDPSLSRRMEPRASAPQGRLHAIRAAAGAGLPVTVLAAPMIPALNDHELETLLEAAAGAGAMSAGYILLRLPLELKELFEGWLVQHFPDRKDRVLNRIRAMRGGRLYDSRFGARMKGQGVEAELLAQRFQKAATRLGLNKDRPDLRSDLFCPNRAQGELFA